MSIKEKDNAHELHKKVGEWISQNKPEHKKEEDEVDDNSEGDRRICQWWIANYR